MNVPFPSNALHLSVDASDVFDVRRFTVNEGLSSLFSIEVVALCENPAVDFEETVGKEASFEIGIGAAVLASLGDAPAPKWTGIVSEIHQVQSEESGLSTYHLTLVPRLWLLTQRTNCRVFQQMSDLDVVRALLAEWGIEPVIEASRTFKTRKYRVQYQETDHAFFCRMLESAGVTYFFRRGQGGTTLVLADGPESGARRKLPLEHVNQPLGGQIHATAFRASRAVRSGRFTLADHDLRLANTPLLGEAQSSAHPIEASLERFIYTPGAFRYGAKGPKDTPHADDRGRTRSDPDEARRLAEQAARASFARAKTFGFSSNAVDLAAGTIVEIGNHAVADREGALLLTRVVVTGSFDAEPKLACEAVSAGAPFRPEAVTVSPTIQGVECATVVGPAGETIHTDEFGRVRVQFHWDRYGTMDEQSSCWVPCNQPWAGDASGAVNLPRVGQEVIVGFLAGNPEEPVVVGRLFTNLLRPPFPLPANKSQNGYRSASVPATGGYNEMMFEDKAGGELLRMRAERDMSTRVNRDHEMSIGNDRRATIDGHDTQAVMKNVSHTIGGDLSHAVAGSSKHAVEGDQSQAILGQMMSSVGQDALKSVLGSLLSSAGGERILQTLGNYVSQALSHQITSQIGTTISVGASMIHIGPDSIIIQSPKVLLNPGEEAAASASLGGPTAP